MKRLKYLPVLLFLFYSCSQERIYNEDNYWTSEELAELDRIVEVFDNSLVDTYRLSKEEAYPTFANDFSTSIEVKGSFISPLNTEMDISKLKVFQKIWKKVRDSTDMETLELDIEREYFDYLQNLSSKSVVIEEYMNGFINKSDSQNSLVFRFVGKSRDLNFNDINNRLIFSINFLTLEN